MKIIITKKRRIGNKTIKQLDETKLAETLTIEDARDSLFLKQQTIMMINKANTKAPTAIKMRVVSLAKIG
jgi:hypothetical protein